MKKQRSNEVRIAERVSTRDDLLAGIDRATLTNEEEQVLRMLHQLPVAPDQPLALKSDDPQVVAALARIEAATLRSLRKAGKVTRKDLIVARLKRRP